MAVEDAPSELDPEPTTDVLMAEVEPAPVLDAHAQEVLATQLKDLADVAKLGLQVQPGLLLR